MPSPLQDSALVIIGHGSTLNPDSSAPTHQHADAIREMNLFAEVVCVFWKEEPSMREVYPMIRSKEVYFVPNFISEGYFCQQVLPRELRLEGPVTQRDGKTLFYCDPVGIHPSMTKLLLKRADEVTPGVPRDQTALIIVGHGTSLNENSRKAIEDQVMLIRDGGHGFAEVIDAYMEEAPFVAKWHDLTTAPHVVVVPFFIADGLHSFQDIPVLLGIESEVGAAMSQSDVFRHNPHEMHGRKLYYSSAIGTEALMAEVILDQVHDTRAKHAGAESHSSAPAQASPLPQGRFSIGEITCAQSEDGTWRLQHRADLGREDLVLYTEAEAAREIANLDEANQFRPLHAAPTLRHGWQLWLPDEANVRLALDFFYPAALGFWEHHQAGTLEPVALRDTLGRQTGMYRFANSIRDDQAQQMVACECDPVKKCARRIVWPLTPEQPLTDLPPEKLLASPLPSDEIPVLCVEACTHLVSAARSIAQQNYKASQG
jgi:sirohydrochlorin cobaltochelatase